MGNTGKGGRARLKNQAPKIQVSGTSVLGEPTGGGSNNSGFTSEELTISLIKLNRLVCEQAKIGDAVSLQWQDGSYPVYLNGQILGYVPTVYNSSLNSPTNHRGRITQILLDPNPNISIKVRVSP
ncbi:hypothetical protein GC194_10115 [bacterium]|nr:hypothetical protein [bacterium]